MTTPTMLWFFLWRMSVWGLGLGAGFGATYGAVSMPTAYVLGELLRPAGERMYQGTELFTHPLSGFLGFIVVGAVFGVVLGAPLGLILGTLDGLVLFFATVTFLDLAHANHPAVYRRKAGWVCASGGILFLLIDWSLNGFPDAAAFAPWRMLFGYFFTTYGRGIGTNDLWSGDNFFTINDSMDTLIAIVVIVVGPLVTAF